MVRLDHIVLYNTAKERKKDSYYRFFKRQKDDKVRFVAISPQDDPRKFTELYDYYEFSTYHPKSLKLPIAILTWSMPDRRHMVEKKVIQISDGKVQQAIDLAKDIYVDTFQMKKPEWKLPFNPLLLAIPPFLYIIIKKLSQ